MKRVGRKLRICSYKKLQKKFVGFGRTLLSACTVKRMKNVLLAQCTRGAKVHRGVSSALFKEEKLWLNENFK